MTSPGSPATDGQAAGAPPAPSGAARPPRVTVAIPVYKGQDYLALALEAVLAQTYTDREVIVVDDASPDGTVALARRFEARGVAVHVNPENLRQVGNSNRCAALARGEYLLITHHDDLLAPAHLERTVAALDAAPGAAFAYTGFREVGADGAPLEERRPRPRPGPGPRPGSSVRPGRAWALEVLTGRDMPVRFPSTLIRASALREAGGFDPRYPLCLDFDLWMRLAGRHDVAFVDEALLDYRRHPGQETASGRARQYLEHARIRAASLARLEAAGALSPDEAARARRFIGRESARTARKFARTGPLEARALLEIARAHDPRAAWSWNALLARARLFLAPGPPAG